MPNKCINNINLMLKQMFNKIQKICIKSFYWPCNHVSRELTIIMDSLKTEKRRPPIKVVKQSIIESQWNWIKLESL